MTLLIGPPAEARIEAHCRFRRPAPQGSLPVPGVALATGGRDVSTISGSPHHGEGQCTAPEMLDAAVAGDADGDDPAGMRVGCLERGSRGFRGCRRLRDKGLAMWNSALRPMREQQRATATFSSMGPRCASRSARPVDSPLGPASQTITRGSPSPPAQPARGTAPSRSVCRRIPERHDRQPHDCRSRLHRHTSALAEMTARNGTGR